MKNRAICSLTSMLLSCALEATAFGQSMAVVGYGCENPGSPEAIVRALREALSRKAPAVQPEAITVAALGGMPTGSLADTERVLGGIGKDISRMEYEHAAEALSVAMRELTLAPPSRGKCSLLREASMMLAWSQMKLHKENEANETIKKAVRIEAVRPDPARYPPSFDRFVANVRAQTQKAAKSSLGVTTRPAGYPVYVDGCPVGESPLKIQVPSSGEYRVEIAFPSGQSLPNTIKIQGDAALEFDEDFDGAIYTNKGPCVAFSKDREKRIKSLVRLATLLKARSIVTLREEEEPAQGAKYFVSALVDSSTGQEIREARVKIPAKGMSQNDIEKLAEWIATGDALPPVEQTRGIIAAKNTNPTAKDSGPSNSGTLRRTAMWSLLGLSAVFGTVAIVEHVRIGNKEKEMDGLRTPGTNLVSSDNRGRYRDLQGEVDTAKKLRTGFAIGAGAALAGSGTLFLISLHQQKTDGSAAAQTGVSLLVRGEF